MTWIYLKQNMWTGYFYGKISVYKQKKMEVNSILEQ